LFDHGQVIVQVEAGVIDPDRAPAAQRDLLQPLPQPWDRRDPLLQYRSQGTDIQTTAYVEDQHSADLQRRRMPPRGERHQVVRAHPLKHRSQNPASIELVQRAGTPEEIRPLSGLLRDLRLFVRPECDATLYGRGGEVGNHAATFAAPHRHEWSLFMTSPQDEKPAVGSFAELSEADCKELLAQHSAGRIGFMAGDGPQILPVTYQYRNGSVVFRTSPAGPLAGLVRRTSVAFEIDSIDEQTKSGWSVLVLGFAEAMAHNSLLTSAWETGPVPWADGVRNLFIEVKPRKISGRAVGRPSRD
jgi:uncharacterized protein